MTETLVDEHFDEAPVDAAEAVANATILLSWLLRQAGERDRALELLGRLSERYGRPGVPGYRLTAAEVSSGTASILAEAGRADEALRRFDALIEDVGDTSDPELRRILADAYVRKAKLLSDKGLLEDGIAICREVVERFANFHDPEIAERVAWAQLILDEYAAPPSRRRRFGKRR